MTKEGRILTSGSVRAKLTMRQKLSLSKDAQALVEAGFMTPSLELISRKHLIKNLLLPMFEKQYADLARQELAEDDKQMETEKKS
jgi:hypothetical protein